MLNKSATITLYGLSLTDPKVEHDPELDGTFVDCSSDICTEVSYSGGNFTFTVTGFSSYRAIETPLDLGGAVPSGGGGGGGGGGGSRIICQERWTCSDWGTCSDEIQTRTCSDSSNCGTFLDKPIETKPCLEPCKEEWRCTGWGPCEENFQIRICSDINICDTELEKPNETQDCGLKPTGEKITGQILKPVNLPNPQFLIPTVLLLIILIVLLSLRHAKVSKGMRKFLAVLHISLIAIIFMLLFLTFKLLIKIKTLVIVAGLLALIIGIIFFSKIYKRRRQSKRHKKVRKSK